MEPEPYEAKAFGSEFAVDDLVYITSGPWAGRAWRVKATGGAAIELEGGHLLGAWPLGPPLGCRASLRWLDCPAHCCPRPLAAGAVARPLRHQRVVDAARLLQVPGPATPSSFVAGVWRGDAVLLKGRELHPTASAERAQDLCGRPRLGRKGTPRLGARRGGWTAPRRRPEI